MLLTRGLAVRRDVAAGQISQEPLPPQARHLGVQQTLIQQPPPVQVAHPEPRHGVRQPALFTQLGQRAQHNLQSIRYDGLPGGGIEPVARCCKLHPGGDVPTAAGAALLLPRALRYAARLDA